jgi:antitoxin HicB
MVFLPPQRDQTRQWAEAVAQAVPDATIVVAETVEEALREGADALRSWVGTMRDLGRPVPPPSSSTDKRYSGRWVMRVPRSLHRRLAERAREEGVSLNALATSLLAEGLARQANPAGSHPTSDER